MTSASANVQIYKGLCPKVYSLFGIIQRVKTKSVFTFKKVKGIVVVRKKSSGSIIFGI